MILKEIDKDSKLVSLLDNDFLTKLNEVGKLYGWCGDYFEIAEFVKAMYDRAGQPEPDTEAYEIIYDEKGPGKYVKLDDGRQGRVFNNAEIIASKVPVYLAVEYSAAGEPVKFSSAGVLLEPAKLSVIGYFD